MRHRLLLVLLVASPFQFARATAKSDARHAIIVIRPTEHSFDSQERVLLEVSVSNHSRKDLFYVTCPGPYKIEVSDRFGSVVLAKSEAVRESSVEEAGNVDVIVDLPLGSCFSGVIKVGETWKQQVAPTAGLNLMPAGIYSVQMVWTFTTGVRNAGGREAPITLQVSSNRTDITISK